MRVLAACSLGGAGHLNPMLALLAAARERGDDTEIIGPPAMQAMIEASGHRYVRGGEPSEAEIAPIRERLPLAPPGEASVLGNRELFGRLATIAMLPTMEEHCSRATPDLLLREPCEYASAVVAGARRIPTAQVAISLADAERGSIDAAAPALEAHRAGLVDELLAMPYLSRFPAALDPSPFPTTLRFRDRPDRAATRLPDWWPGSDAPLVYLTFGTVLGHMSMATAVYRTAIRAVADIDARVLLTVGNRIERDELGPLPDQVHVESWVDQHDVLAEADLVVCHGGSGTAFGALGAGVPLVIVPVFADQFENGRRIATTGAGFVVEVEPGRGDGVRQVVGDADVPRIADAVTAALATPSLRARAREIAAEMAAAPEPGALLARLGGGATAV